MNERLAMPRRRLFLLLTAAFLLFYGLQVTWTTTNQDVLLYSARALSPRPIVTTTYTPEEPAGNIHLGHTVAVWLFYQAMPEGLRRTIWPAGLLSALAGALSAGLTFLIWLELGLDRRTALVIATVAGLVPSIWYHSLIGETYALELCGVLGCLYLFQRQRWIAATLVAAAVLLVDPLVLFALPVLLVAAPGRATWVRATLVVGVGGLLFMAAMYATAPDFLTSFLQFGAATARSAIPFLWRPLRLAVIVALNLSFLIPWLVIGAVIAARRHARTAVILLGAALLSQAFFFVAGSAGWTLEVGSFQLFLLWACCFPIGLALARRPLARAPVVACLLGFLLVGWWNWIVVTHQVAEEREEAACWVRAQRLEEPDFIGNSEAGAVIALEQYGWDYRTAMRHLDHTTFPGAEALLRDGHDSWIIVVARRSHPTVRSMLVSLSDTFRDVDWTPTIGPGEGTVEKVFENGSVTLYRWRRDAGDEGRVGA